MTDTATTSLRDRILQTVDISREVVEVPEWECSIEVRSMTARARARMLATTVRDTGQLDWEKLYPALLIASCYDADTGELIFTAADEEALAGRSAAPVERLAQVAMRVSGLSQDGAAALGKDSSPTQNGAST